MPLTSKGSEILGNMREQYGEAKGERVFYASKNKGTIEGVDAMSVTPRAEDDWSPEARAAAAKSRGGGGGGITPRESERNIRRDLRPQHEIARAYGRKPEDIRQIKGRDLVTGPSTPTPQAGVSPSITTAPSVTPSTPNTPATTTPPTLTQAPTPDSRPVVLARDQARLAGSR